MWSQLVVNAFITVPNYKTSKNIPKHDKLRFIFFASSNPSPTA